VLEIGSGSGEHAVFLAPALAVRAWQPSDPDADSRASIDAWRHHAGEAALAVLPAIALDVLNAATPWPEVLTSPEGISTSPDVVVCINMIHISPWRACLALLEGAAGVLPPGGVLYLYGPFKRGGRHTAPSNEAFDEGLRSRDTEWGVRDLDDVTREARSRGLACDLIAPMPANNLSIVFRRAAS
jgi:hypothetical protein